MSVVLAIDPGSERSAWLVLRDGRPALIGGTATDEPIHAHGIVDNDDLLRSLRFGDLPNGLLGLGDVVVIEQIESFGMAVGREVFDTVHWAGRFTEAAHPTPVVQLPRRAVKLAICGSAKARDANIRQALIDRFGGSAAIGRKATPGPLYGVAKDVWSALAIAVTYADQEAAR
jgi:hypothetical protein